MGSFGAANSFDEMQSRLVMPPVTGSTPKPASVGPVTRHAKPGYTNFYPAGARLNSGAIVLTWTADFKDGVSGNGFVVTRRRSSDTPTAPTPRGVFGPINNVSPPPQPDVVQNFESEPSVAALANGSYAVAYTDRVPSQFADISVRLFAANGTRGGDLSVNVRKEGVDGGTTIIGLRGGGFVVGWTRDYGYPTVDRGNFIRVYNASNRPITNDVKVPGSGYGPTELAPLGGIGEFLVTYPSAQGLRARRYVAQP
jgi:hypothetical protein